MRVVVCRFSAGRTGTDRLEARRHPVQGQWVAIDVTIRTGMDQISADSSRAVSKRCTVRLQVGLSRDTPAERQKSARSLTQPPNAATSRFGS